VEVPDTCTNFLPTGDSSSQIEFALSTIAKARSKISPKTDIKAKSASSVTRKIAIKEKPNYH